jgi:choline transporter-like protein 2/4/5
MFSSLFFPVLPFLLQLVVLAWFLVVALFLSSWGTQEYRIALKSNSTEVSLANQPCSCSWPNTTSFELQPGQLCLPSTSSLLPTDGGQQNATCTETCPHLECQFVKYSKNKDYSWMQFVNVFGLYWGIFFFTAFGELVLAGVFAEWYWTKDKSKLPSCTLGSSLWNATIFHLGTVAFGSLIIAIIRMVRTVLEYVEKKCNKFNNDLTKCLLKCCQCCLWCLEKFMRFINRNAYIMCAVKSTNFCKSAKDAFNLLMRNLVRVVVLDSVVDFLLFLGKLVIVLLTGVTSYLAFAGYIPELKDQIPSLNYMYTPVVFIVIGSYMIASSFFGVYAMAVDTLFLCFLEDLERNDGSLERPYYMTKDMNAILGKMQHVAGESRRHH